MLEPSAKAHIDAPLPRMGDDHAAASRGRRDLAQPLGDIFVGKSVKP